MRYFARDISTVGVIFLVDNRRINVDKCQVPLRSVLMAGETGDARQHPVRIFILSYFNFITYLLLLCFQSPVNITTCRIPLMRIFFVVLYHYTHKFDVNQPCVPTAGFRQQKSGLFGLGFCCSAVFVRNANMGTSPYPAEQHTLKDNSELRKSFLQALYGYTIGRCGWIKQG